MSARNSVITKNPQRYITGGQLVRWSWGEQAK
ncbi:hypothetical protein J2S10_003955 [Neobacillus ginsengisoli]|uniref:Uncharacterized protein n=1 Tax=Neobacillus ginsengisoli TaxID=904295 RepID=A0ABT9XYW8_9BACI|nr:hypothetical protein [Neobacillus ginsengisoli]